ncbi:MAG TPA: hypothetical protein VNV66_15800 [Pilimelia sp.]|nr:hypothetical protein [Pilimelia sp.]
MAGRSVVGPRYSRLRLVLLVVGGVLALLCLGGLGIGYALYDDATRIERDHPDVVVDNYLRALLVDRNDTTAQLYVCRSPSLGQVQNLRRAIDDLESRHSIQIRVSWGSLESTETGATARVRTEIRRSISDGSETDRSVWEFTVVAEDGWRVCAARGVG